MSNLRNSIFLGATPAIPPSAFPSTGSALLDAFVAEAESRNIALQTSLTENLTSLSFELRRAASGRAAAPATPPKSHEHETDVQVKNQPVTKPVSEPVTEPIDQALDAKTIGAQIAKDSKAEAIRAEARSTEARSIEARSIEARRAKVTSVEPEPERDRPAKVEPVAAQSTQYSSAPPRPLSPSHVKKVYGGSHYKALQSKAAAGGLVNLDDALLFGGADINTAHLGAASKRLQDDDFLNYQSGEIEDFTASPIPGGLHTTAYLSEANATGEARDAWRQTVLAIEMFRLKGLVDEGAVEIPKTRIDPIPVSSSVDQNNADSEAQTVTQTVAQTDDELSQLSEQISYLNQKVEYLSGKIAELNSSKAQRLEPSPSEQPLPVPSAAYP